MRYKHILYAFLLLVLSILGILNVWNSWQFQIQEYQLTTFAKKQQETLEQNKRLRANIVALSAPERLLVLIERNPQWQLKQIDSKDIIIIEIQERKTR